MTVYSYLRFDINEFGERVDSGAEVHIIDKETFESEAIERGYLPNVQSFEVYEDEDSFNATYVEIYDRREM